MTVKTAARAKPDARHRSTGRFRLAVAMLILLPIAFTLLLGLAATKLSRQDPSESRQQPTLSAPKSVASGRSYMVKDGISSASAKPVWELASLAGVPQSCAITRVWSVEETTHGLPQNTTVHLLLCPKRGYWILNYDEKRREAGSSGPFRRVDEIEAMIDPGGVIVWNGPRPLDLRDPTG